MKVKENVYTCGTCKHYVLYGFFDVERYCCGIIGQPVSKQHTCDGWTDPDEVELTEEERYDGGVMSNFDNENPKEVEDYINEN